MLVDRSAFRNIEEKWQEFKREPHKLRLSLAGDSANPFGETRSTYLAWPVFVINNKIPLWKSIKRENIMLTMIVLINLFRIFFLAQ